jgi:hypothetical protein
MKYVKTSKGVIGRAYNEIRRIVKKEGSFALSKLEFVDIIWKDEAFLDLYNEYRDAKCDQRLLPVIEKADIEKSFSLDNIRWVTQQDARIRSRPKVLVTDKDGNVSSFSSAFEAEKKLKLPQGVLSRVIRTKKGKYKQWHISTSQE